MSRVITITGWEPYDDAKWPDERDKGVIFNNCAPFTESTMKINNTQIDFAKDLNVVMPMYNLIEYSNNYSKKSRNLSQNERDVPNANLANSESLISKVKITGQ